MPVSFNRAQTGKPAQTAKQKNSKKPKKSTGEPTKLQQILIGLVLLLVIVVTGFFTIQYFQTPPPPHRGALNGPGSHPQGRGNRQWNNRGGSGVSQPYVPGASQPEEDNSRGAMPAQPGIQ